MSRRPLRFERDYRQALVEVCSRMYSRGTIVAMDGNVSCRLPNGKFLTTPKGVCKGDLVPEMLVVVDAKGKSVSGGEPTSELKLHLEVYREIGTLLSHPEACAALLSATSPHEVIRTVADVTG